jgi:transcriptional regulator with XRE-family HTH domain
MEQITVRDWRSARGVTQEQLAALLGVTRVTIWRWETQPRTCPPYLWRALRDLDRDLVEATQSV